MVDILPLLVTWVKRPDDDGVLLLSLGARGADSESPVALLKYLYRSNRSSLRVTRDSDLVVFS